jgi:lipopolysaccharide exporter
VNPTPAHRQVLVGGTWLVAARAVDRLIGVVSISILARVLKPVDFGLVAIATTVAAGIEILSAFGFDFALVRHRDPSTEDLNSAWTLRVLFGLLTFIGLALLGPVAAAFYHQPALQALILAMGGASFTASLENIGTVYFRREFAFHKEFLIRAASKLAGFCVTVTLALLYRSYWSLVAGVFAIRGTTVLASYVFHPFRPRLSLRRARPLFAFSVWLLAANLIEYCREKFGDLFVARLYGPRVNGLFAVSAEISWVPLTEVAAPINRAAFSKYAQDVRANRGLRASYVSVAPLIWMISLPMAAGIVAVAPEAIELLLGPQWYAARAVLRWLAIGTAFTVMTTNTQTVYWALGHTRVAAGLGMAGAAIVVPATIICAYFGGYTGVAFAFALTSALLVPINFAVLRRLAGIRFADLWSRVWRIAVGTAVMSLVLWLCFPETGFADTRSAILLFIGKTASGAVTYVLAVWLAWLLCGKPAGPEGVALEWVGTAAGRLRARFAGNVT